MLDRIIGGLNTMVRNHEYAKVMGRKQMPRNVSELPDQLFLPPMLTKGLAHLIDHTGDARTEGTDLILPGGEIIGPHFGQEESVSREAQMIYASLVRDNKFGLAFRHTHPYHDRRFSIYKNTFSGPDLSTIMRIPRLGTVAMLATDSSVVAVVHTEESLEREEEFNNHFGDKVLSDTFGQLYTAAGRDLDLLRTYQASVLNHFGLGMYHAIIKYEDREPMLEEQHDPFIDGYTLRRTPITELDLTYTGKAE
jgi:hypothetical protein